MNDLKGLAAIIAIIAGVALVTIMTQGAREAAEAEGIARQKISMCIRELDTPEKRCRQASPNECTLTAAEFERYNLQLNQRRAYCSQRIGQ
jgi:hypothetical protein